MTTQKGRLARTLPYILLMAGIIGLLASIVILVDTLKLQQNPNYQPSCSINPIISCGSVMRSSEARLFGFSNPYIGVLAFPVLMVTGIALLAGVKMKRRFWVGLNAGAFLGVLFVHWLFLASVYRINALCPYCVVVWIMTITTFWYVTLYNLEVGNLSLHPKLHKVHITARQHHADILAVWLLVIATLILTHFWYYFGSRL